VKRFSNLRSALKGAFLCVLLVTAPSALLATGNPFDGYSNTLSYNLLYTDGTSFAPVNVGLSTDVRAGISIAGKEHFFNVDTGSRGLYVALEELQDGTRFTIDVPGAYAGQIDLSSSGRIAIGTWVPTTGSFSVIGSGGPTTITSSFNILAVTALGSQVGKSPTYTINASVPHNITTANLEGGGTVPITDGPNRARIITLTDGQTVTYADNPGMFASVSNFGIGFDLGGGRGTGPVTNNQNQIYNPLLNFEEMVAPKPSLVAGYIIKRDWIQIGLTSEDTGYGYTTLNTTGLTSENSVPDWQTPMGQTVVNGKTHDPGSIVMDSGIGYSFLSDPGLRLGETHDQVTVYLMNSGGSVGYHINVNDPDNILSPTEIKVVSPTTTGVYSQGQDPFRTQFFNTGRDVFEGFDMLYDASNGFMGVKPNEHGLKDPNIFFTAQQGGFPNPIPEPGTLGLLGLGAFLMLYGARNRRSRMGRTPTL